MITRGSSWAAQGASLLISLCQMKNMKTINIHVCVIVSWLWIDAGLGKEEPEGQDLRPGRNGFKNNNKSLLQAET